LAFGCRLFFGFLATKFCDLALRKDYLIIAGTFILAEVLENVLTCFLENE